MDALLEGIIERHSLSADDGAKLEGIAELHQAFLFSKRTDESGQGDFKTGEDRGVALRDLSPELRAVAEEYMGAANSAFIRGR